MKMKFDPHKKALDELMSHLDQSDDMELGEAMKPKEGGLEVTKVEASGDPEMMEEPADPEGGAKLSEEEIAELIEALQSKLA